MTCGKIHISKERPQVLVVNTFTVAILDAKDCVVHLLTLYLISSFELLAQLGYLKISCLPITIMSRQQRHCLFGHIWSTVFVVVWCGSFPACEGTARGEGGHNRKDLLHSMTQWGGKKKYMKRLSAETPLAFCPPSDWADWLYIFPQYYTWTRLRDCFYRTVIAQAGHVPNNIMKTYSRNLTRAFDRMWWRAHARARSRWFWYPYPTRWIGQS